MIILHNILILVDYFCIFKFQTPLIQDKIDILLETNPDEVSDFLNTYLSFSSVAVIVLAVAAFNLSSYLLASAAHKLLKHKGWCAITAAIGFGGWIFMAVSYKMYGNGFSIPQFTSPTRIAYSYHTYSARYGDIKALCQTCKNAEAASSFGDTPNVVVVIGESFSVYHSPLFGYEKDTNPLLGKRIGDGSMVVFGNAVSVSDHTHGVMESVFSPDLLHKAFSSTPVFPALFRKAGYKSLCYENQYFIDGKMNFLCNEELSGLMFDERNNTKYEYDGALANTIKASPGNHLYVVHLMGQHYTYSNRYPAEWKKFKADDYDKARWNAEQREKIAHYDNATLYNDFVVDGIIDKFEGTNTIIVYFSDHGQEVFETRDYSGHGNAALSPDIRYQLRVPLMVWMSDKYKEAHPDVYESAVANKNTPIHTDNISHTLLSVAGIKTEWYDPERDFLNGRYDKGAPRIVMKGVDFDKTVQGYGK